MLLKAENSRRVAKSRSVVWTFKAHFPQGEFVRANFKKVGTDPTFWRRFFSRRFFSLINHIAKICFSLHANKFAYWKI
jgi:hypothetical protein